MARPARAAIRCDPEDWAEAAEQPSSATSVNVVPALSAKSADDPAGAGARPRAAGSAPPSGFAPASRRWPSARRLGHIVRVAWRHGLALAAARLARRWPAARRLLPHPAPGGELTGPERLRVAIEDLGGTFIKFGQMLALQPDILPVAYCDALFKLLDRVEPFPFAQAEEIFTAELGRRPAEVFDDVERRPLATASIGQVYVAHLGGRKVAVKIQRPNAEVEFASDIRLMIAAMRLIRWLRLRRLYWLLEPTGEFVAWSAEELDYRNEARYSERLRRHAAGNPVQYVPAVLAEYTTRRVLVVEFLEGVTLLGYLRARDEGNEVLQRGLAAAGFDRQVFAANLVDNFLGDAFKHGIYHADLHPANLMVLPGNVVGYIDFGITGLMSPYSRHHLIAMTLALARGDVETMAAEYLKITAWDARSDLSGFRAGLERLAAGWYEQAAGQRRLSAKITRIFGEILALSRQTRVMPERDIVKYIRSAIAIDGLLVRFLPGFDIGKQIAESCAEYLRREMLHRLLTAEQLLDWGTAGGRLLRDGPALTSRALAGLAGMAAGPAPGAFAGSAASGMAPTSRTSPPSPAPPPSGWAPSGRASGTAAGRPGDRGDAGAGSRARAIQLAAAVLGTAVLIAGSAAPLRLGLNLFTAELLFGGAAAAGLAGALRGLRAFGPWEDRHAR
jgi:ubiquinone biosynthesis protein